MELIRFRSIAEQLGWKQCLLAISFLLAIQSEVVTAQSSPPISIPRISIAPVIDGNVGEEEWRGATRIVVDIETQPADNIRTDVTSEAFIMEDGETLYVAFIAFDPNPSEIRAYYEDRDNSCNCDQIGIVLDTFNDERRAYEFFVTPLGVQFDAINDEINRRYDVSWNAIWTSAGVIGPEGYSVEMAIPLKQLRFPQTEQMQTWGIDLVRLYPRSRFHLISNNPRDRDISCYLCAISKAEGLPGIEVGRNLEIIPTLTAISVENRDPGAGPWEGGDVEPEASLDIRWGINQDIYLNATVNPDFSQVETDRAQLDINRTFSLFFPERRTFFLDGADYFNSHENLVHTRNIASPDYGLKVTGKSGAHTYALMTANDETTAFLIPGSLGSNVASLGDVESDISIGRYRYDIFKNSTIGATVTDRRGDDYDNTVMSIDGVFKFTDQDTLYIQTMRSESHYPQLIQDKYSQQDSLSDSAIVLEYRHNDRRWDWRAQYFDFGEDFRADLGFISKVDYRMIVTTIGHTWRWNGDGFFTRIRIAADYDRTQDKSGLQLEEETEFMLNMNGPMQSSLRGLFGGSETYWNGQYFDEQFNQIGLGFSPMADIILNMNVRIEDVVDFANTRLGRSKRFSPSIRYQLGKHLLIDLRHTLQKFDVEGGRLFTANLTDIKTTYQFTTRSFLRFTLQYSDYERDQSLYQDPVQSRSKQLTSQLLYSYKLNAATRFFIGYSEIGLDDDRYDTLEKTNRTFFAKASYAWLP